MTKLGLSGDAKELTLVPEEDGTVTDDDETLRELQPKTFLLMRVGEQWCTAAESASVVEPLVTSVVPDIGGNTAAVDTDHVSQQSVAPSASEYFTPHVVVDHP